MKAQNVIRHFFCIRYTVGNPEASFSRIERTLIVPDLYSKMFKCDILGLIKSSIDVTFHNFTNIIQIMLPAPMVKG